MDLNILTQVYLKHYRRRLSSPWEINYGDCYRWAILAQKLNGGQLISVTMMCENNFSETPGQYIEDGSHAFVLIDGKYYDSESPEGVIDWRNLNYFLRYEETMHTCNHYYSYWAHPSIRSFKRYWKPKRNISKADLKIYNSLTRKFHES